MPMKDILIELGGGRGGDATLNYGLSLATLLDAHATGVAPVGEVDDAYVFAEAAGVLVQRLSVEMHAAADALCERFLGAAATRGVVAEALKTTISSAAGDRQAAELARHFDLTVVSQPDAQKSTAEPSILQAALFGSGRPILVTPYIQRDPASLEHALVAWDGSREATLALAGALPLLRRAKRVEVTTINAEGLADLPGFNITRHLARHGVRAELRRITSDLDIGNALLSHAADVGADLLVMGGYAHSRFREVVLGGTTRTVLESATLPVLMAH
ncbi:universal stress protein [Alsobacter sp. KACC 23698]|uniref:Universal stress protein n=1 Tax=Alsobacter sp. KACC 23698 TaxID=3149229 RepID=A0AAU7JNM6_9HYPH